MQLDEVEFKGVIEKYENMMMTITYDEEAEANKKQYITKNRRRNRR